MAITRTDYPPLSNYARVNGVFDPITQSVWVSIEGATAPLIAKINVADGTFVTFSLGSYIASWGMVFDAANFVVWVLCSDNSVRSFDCVTGARNDYSLSGSIYLDFGLTLDTVHNCLWFANRDSTRGAGKYDIAGNTTTLYPSNNPSTDSPTGGFYDPINNVVWFVNSGVGMMAFNVGTGISTDYASGEMGSYFDTLDAANNLWGWTGILHKLNTGTGVVTDGFTGTNPYQGDYTIAYDSTNDLLWISDYQSPGNVFAIKASDGSLYDTISVPSYPAQVVMDNVHMALWVFTEGDYTITKLDIGDLGIAPGVGAGYISYDKGGVKGDNTDGSISEVFNLTLHGDTFFGANGVSVAAATTSNVPSGLIATIIKVSDTEARVEFSGNAVAYKPWNSIQNFTVDFVDASFTSLPAASIINSSRTDLIISWGNMVTELPVEQLSSQLFPDGYPPNLNPISRVTPVGISGDGVIAVGYATATDKVSGAKVDNSFMWDWYPNQISPVWPGNSQGYSRPNAVAKNILMIVGEVSSVANNGWNGGGIFSPWIFAVGWGYLNLSYIAYSAYQRAIAVSDDGSTILCDSNDSGAAITVWNQTEGHIDDHQDRGFAHIGFTDWIFLPSTISPLGISGDGYTVFGSMAFFTEIHAAVWSWRDGLYNLGNLSSGKNSYALSSSGDGLRVVGYGVKVISNDGPEISCEHAAYWHNGTVLDIGALLIADKGLPDSTTSRATSISRDGMHVTVKSESSGRAYLYDINGNTWIEIGQFTEDDFIILPDGVAPTMPKVSIDGTTSIGVFS